MTPRLPVWLLAAVVGVAACSDPAQPRLLSPAYDPTEITGGIYRWETGRTISVYTDPAGVPAGKDLAAAVSAALDAWKSALNGSHFSFRIVTRPQDADLLVHSYATQRPVGLAGCDEPVAYAAATALFCPARDTALTLPLLTGGGHVKLVVGIDLSAVSNFDALKALVSHELGHAIGIGGHSLEPKDVMFFAPETGIPTARDAQTLRWLVRQPADLRL